jgi:hypothetical protein
MRVFIVVSSRRLHYFLVRFEDVFFVFRRTGSSAKFSTALTRMSVNKLTIDDYAAAGLCSFFESARPTRQQFLRLQDDRASLPDANESFVAHPIKGHRDPLPRGADHVR